MDDKRIESMIDRIWSNDIDTNKVYKLMCDGNNKLSHNTLVEKLVLDDQWIGQMEYGLRSVENIIRNPKKSILEDRIIVPVEKSKKVNELSIRHLAMHSENVKSFDNDELKPKNVLTPIIEEELAIYENRFVYCLIDRAYQFIEKRWKTIERHMRVSAFENLTVSSKFSIGGARIDCQMNMTVKEKPDSISNERNLKLVARVGDIRRRLSLIKKSEFCRMLKKSKPVYPPIVKTNIITKNVDYNNAYKLWVFLSGYDQDGFSINVKNRNLPFDENYAADMLAINSLIPAVVISNDEKRKEQYEAADETNLMDKRYKVISQIQYRPVFNLPEVKAGEDAINQYFYDKMRNLLGKATGIKSGIIVQKKYFGMEFAKFYSTITKISDAMYDEIIDAIDTPVDKKADKLQLKRIEIDEQTERVRRYKMLVKCKESELNKTLKREIQERIKLENLKAEEANLEGKKLDRDIVRKMAEDKEQREEEQRKLMELKLAELESRLEAEERQKARKAIEEEGSRIKAEREKRERELLKMLKAKYEEGQE